MANKNNQPFDIPDPEAAGWKEDPDRPGFWLWESEVPVTEAPEDGKQYGRQDASWTEIVIPASQWQGGAGGISTNASKVIVGSESTEGAGLYASGKIEVWETTQNNNRLWAGYGGASVTSQIQADGDAKFAGNVDLLGVGRYGRASLGFDTNQIFARNSSDLAASGAVDLGSSTTKWKDGHFAGTVVAGSFELADGSPIGGAPDLTGYATESWVSTNYQVKGNYLTASSLSGYATESWVSTNYQPKGNYLTSFSETDPTVPAHVKNITSTQKSNWNTAHGWGNHASAGYLTSASLSGYATQTWVNNKGYLTSASLTGYATQTWVNNQGFAKGSFVPTSGNTTIAGTLTATNFIATSDERLKDNISPMPVGLIDDIKPVQWDWKDGSGKSAGVVAQQLQSVGLGDFVHETPDGHLSVDYQALTAILLAEVINLKTKMAEAGQ